MASFFSVMGQIYDLPWTREIQKGFSFRGLRPLTSHRPQSPEARVLRSLWPPNPARAPRWLSPVLSQRL